MRYITTIGERQYTIEINRDDQITIDGEAHPIDLRVIDEATFSLLIDHASHEALVESSNGEIQVLLRGHLYTARVEDERASRFRQSGGGLHAGSGVKRAALCPKENLKKQGNVNFASPHLPILN